MNITKAMWEFIQSVLKHYNYTINNIESFEIRFIDLNNTILLHTDDGQTIYISGTNIEADRLRIFDRACLWDGYYGYSYQFNPNRKDTNIWSFDIPFWCPVC